MCSRATRRAWLRRAATSDSWRSIGDVVLVAHSLACTLVAMWAERYPRPIRGAFLVAPSDTEADSYPSGTEGFSPVPLRRLPFPSQVIVSRGDPYVSIERATAFAHAWGSN